MNAFHYNGYVGTFEFEPGDDAFHGEVSGIRDVIHFTGRSVDELRQAFQELDWPRVFLDTNLAV